MGRMITAWLLPLLLAAPGTAPDAQENPEPARYVRIVLPGPARTLSLAEVETDFARHPLSDLEQVAGRLMHREERSDRARLDYQPHFRIGRDQ